MKDAAIEEFLGRFRVDPKGDGTFSGSCYPAWPGRAFGGQLAAQSLQAAFSLRADESLKPWSLHMHFLSPVRANSPITYEVVSLKEGRTLSSRQVFVRQEGKVCATALAVFAASMPGPEHQYPMPSAPPPESLVAQERFIHPSIVAVDADFDALGYPEQAQIEMRVADAEPSADGPDFERQAWMRVLLDVPEDPMTTACVLSYFSDIVLGTMALTPHGGRDGAPDLQLGAIELALWFTGPVKVDEWVLLVEDSLFAGRGHGLAHSLFYNSAGELCAVALQNALLRSR